MTIVDDLISEGCQATLIGSRAICDPVPTSSDEDYLIYHKPTLSIDDVLKKHGLDIAAPTDYGNLSKGDFRSFRSGNINLIITTKTTFETKFLLAVHVCRSLNLLSKSDRILVHQAILYGNKYEKKKLAKVSPANIWQLIID